MRQCQQERRIATQLMAIRKEKETIRNNRVFRLQQHEEQRVREFNEALDRERVGMAARISVSDTKLKWIVFMIYFKTNPQSSLVDIHTYSTC